MLTHEQMQERMNRSINQVLTAPEYTEIITSNGKIVNAEYRMYLHKLNSLPKNEEALQALTKNFEILIQHHITSEYPIKSMVIGLDFRLLTPTASKYKLLGKKTVDVKSINDDIVLLSYSSSRCCVNGKEIEKLKYKMREYDIGYFCISFKEFISELTINGYKLINSNTSQVLTFEDLKNDSSIGTISISSPQLQNNLPKMKNKLPE